MSAFFNPEKIGIRQKFMKIFGYIWWRYIIFFTPDYTRRSMHVGKVFSHVVPYGTFGYSQCFYEFMTIIYSSVDFIYNFFSSHLWVIKNIFTFLFYKLIITTFRVAVTHGTFI